MELTWIDPQQPDRRDVAAAVALREAARAVDRPFMLSPTVTWFIARLRHGWGGDPPIVALARDERGRVAGLLEVWLPRWDNLHVGSVGVTVDPGSRRLGLGRQIFDAGVERVRAHGCTVVLSDSFDQPASAAFAKAMGMDRASEAIHRRQRLDAVDWARVADEYTAAEGHARGYELLRLAGATPEDLLGDVATMTAAINDAPIDDLDIEDEVFPPERIRAYEEAMSAYGWRLYRVVARERETGVLAGHTIVAVDRERPWHGWQHDTSVLRPHRGHRLGLLLKLDMMRWLAEEEPQVRAIDTDNAASNAHMISVNERLGYEVIAKSIEWQRHL